jgi:RhoGEF domain
MRRKRSNSKKDKTPRDEIESTGPPGLSNSGGSASSKRSSSKSSKKKRRSKTSSSKTLKAKKSKSKEKAGGDKAKDEKEKERKRAERNKRRSRRKTFHFGGAEPLAAELSIERVDGEHVDVHVDMDQSEKEKAQVKSISKDEVAAATTSSSTGACDRKLSLDESARADDGDEKDAEKAAKMKATISDWSGEGQPVQRKWRQKYNAMKGGAPPDTPVTASLASTAAASMGAMPVAAASSSRESKKAAAAADVQPKKLSSDQRTNVLDEILTTERDYVRDLDVIVNTYLRSLRLQEKLLSAADLQAIFSNVEQLLIINTELLKSLEVQTPRAQQDGDAATPTSAADANQVSVGDAMLRIGQFLKAYTTYCSNQERAVELLLAMNAKSERLAEVLDYCKGTAEARNLDLPSYLIKPVQRVCKYPLLLRELIKCTPEDHDDYDKLRRAQSMMQQTVLFINEGKRTAEANEWLFELQKRIEGAVDIGLLAPARKFLREGAIHNITADRKVREGHFFLFNDLFLYCEPPQHRHHSGEWQLVAHFPFASTLVNASPGEMSSPNAFEIVHLAHAKLILYMDTEQDKQQLFVELADGIRAAKGGGQVIEAGQVDIKPRRPQSAIGASSTTGADDDWRARIRGKALPKVPQHLKRANTTASGATRSSTGSAVSPPPSSTTPSSSSAPSLRPRSQSAVRKPPSSPLPTPSSPNLTSSSTASASAVCNKCSTKLNGDIRFCTNCGAPRSAASPTPLQSRSSASPLSRPRPQSSLPSPPPKSLPKPPMSRNSTRN